MNGRVYDYNMGRFMSVDPFIQSPTSTQSVNPYSYIMNNPLSGTDPTGYAASCYEKGFLCTFDEVRPGESVNGAKSCIPGSCGSRSNNSNGSTQDQSSKNEETQNSDIGGLGGIANQGKQGGFASASEGRIGSIDKDMLGKASRDSQKTYDKALSFFENDENNEGDTIHFEDKYAISIRSTTNHGEVYKPKLFNDFKEANEYSGRKYRDGYEKVWLDGYHYGGDSYIYKTATFVRGRLSGVERVLAVMAHESRHYNKLDPSRARKHNTNREHMAFQIRSTQTIKRYRTMKNGDPK